MIAEWLKPPGAQVMTPFGSYEPSRFEEWAFKYVYGAKWQEEICEYANSVMEEQWIESKK